MDYQQTLDWMFRQLPMYQTQGASAYKKDLVNTLLLSDYLGNPEKNIKSIHVAGTNGKGSTSHMLASVLQEAGYKVGLYTSPHLKDFRERIMINGEMIATEFVTDFINTHQSFFEVQQLSFFEMTIGLAFDYFARERVDIAVVEVGMGGRLDSTNIIIPLVSVITNIGLDHTQFLGNTLAAIAFEKAGIIKAKVPVVIGEFTDETRPVFIEKAKSCQAPVYFASDLIDQTPESVLKGDYQKYNKKTVLQTIRVLQSQGVFKITEDHIRNGFMQVIDNTRLQGRWQQLHDFPKVICDTAHNKHGLSIVLRQLINEKYEKLHLVLGFVNDKNLDDILPLFPSNAIYYFSKPANARGLDASFLQQKAAGFGLIGKVYGSVPKAYSEAMRLASPKDLIYVGGSTFVVAEIL